MLDDFRSGAYKKNKWSNIWERLKDCGWYWMRGRGLVTFYYIRPNCGIAPPFTNGIDYFTSEEEVISYIKYTSKKYCTGVNDKVDQLLESEVKKYSDILPNKRLIKHSNIKSNKIGPDEEEGEEDTIQDRIVKECLSKFPDKINNSEHIADLAATLDIFQAPWIKVWKILRTKGWKWEFGTGLIKSWYLSPGCLWFRNYFKIIINLFVLIIRKRSENGTTRY
jgi:hypothetical protein